MELFKSNLKSFLNGAGGIAIGIIFLLAYYYIKDFSTQIICLVGLYMTVKVIRMSQKPVIQEVEDSEETRVYLTMDKKTQTSSCPIVQSMMEESSKQV